jgi:hypothetical protein
MKMVLANPQIGAFMADSVSQNRCILAALLKKVGFANGIIRSIDPLTR